MKKPEMLAVLITIKTDILRSGVGIATRDSCGVGSESCPWEIATDRVVSEAAKLGKGVKKRNNNEDESAYSSL